MTPEMINAWFDPFHYFVYLSVIFVLMTVIYQWKWSKEARNNIQVLVVRSSGKGDFILVPKTGNTITLKSSNDKNDKSVKTWPINQLATITLPYPTSIGFLPKFLLKDISTTVVNEDDWEPMLNRSAHKTKVASPDMVAAIKIISERASATTRKQLDEVLEDVSTAPSREMIASPAFLGVIKNEAVSAMILAISDNLKELMEPLKLLEQKLKSMINPVVFYIMMGVMLIAVIIAIYMVMGANKDIADQTIQLEAIQRALGIVVTPTP